jgi:coproporphyrinogen III oxidase-like Fe-S oxidoreductase
MEQFIRQFLLKRLTGEREIRFTKAVPSRETLRAELAKTDAIGVYLHVPFCAQICPYCPYNKEIYQGGLAAAYAGAVRKEMGLYAELLDGKPVSSCYIGGGTPTTMLHSGLPDMIGQLRRVFNLQCDIHMESHPNHLSAANLDAIAAMGVRCLSIGVEALFDRHLETLHRPYTVSNVKEAVGRAVAHGFDCVNVDVMFGLPGQTLEEVGQTAHELVAMGVDQVAAYPIFLFPHTPMGRTEHADNHSIRLSLKRRKMLAIFEEVLYAAGYERSSAWAFTRKGVARYCSVTVPAYIGLGASGGSYLRDMFYLNTFGAAGYVKALEEDRLPVALTLGLSERMQRAGWLYWRIYETRFSRTAYRERFGEDIDRAYGGYLRLLRLMGFLKDDGEKIVLSDSGSFWLHACEDIVSIDYIGKLWGASRRELWPEEVVL